MGRYTSRSLPNCRSSRFSGSDRSLTSALIKPSRSASVSWLPREKVCAFEAVIVGVHNRAVCIPDLHPNQRRTDDFLFDDAADGRYRSWVTGGKGVDDLRLDQLLRLGQRGGPGVGDGFSLPDAATRRCRGETDDEQGRQTEQREIGRPGGQPSTANRSPACSPANVPWKSTTTIDQWRDALWSSESANRHIPAPARTAGILSGGHTMRFSTKAQLALAGIAATTLLSAAPVMAQGGGGGGNPSVASGHCSGPGTWRLKAKPDDNRIEAEFEVDGIAAGPTWHVTLKDDGVTFFAGNRRASSGADSLKVEARTARPPRHRHRPRSGDELDNRTNLSRHGQAVTPPAPAAPVPSRRRLHPAVPDVGLPASRCPARHPRSLSLSPR